jgi:hypothetical protein
MSQQSQNGRQPTKGDHSRNEGLAKKMEATATYPERTEARIETDQEQMEAEIKTPRTAE